MKLDLDQQQVEAVEKCVDVTKRITWVTGPAGTGKTTILRTVYDLLHEAGYNIALCAPTGKAARRIQEATGLPAKTIHALLEYPHPGDRDEETGKVLSTTDPRRCKQNPLDQFVVLADEFAMVPTDVYRNLIEALPSGGILRAFGDINQLKPIEKFKVTPQYKSPFEYLIANFDGVTLTNIHRQGEGSGIVHNGALILKGRMPVRKDDFSIRVTDIINTALLDFISDNPDVDFMALDNQIIVPQRVRNCGSIALNALMQDVLNPAKLRYPLERHKWAKEKCSVAVGDKVIWTQNNYDLGIMNGETGVIEDISEFGEIDINFGDRNIIVPPMQLVETGPRDADGNRATASINPQRDLELAYAITTHKAQGSEYQTVVYAINKAGSFNLCRSNFYTAVTRARKHVHLITDQRGLSYSVTRLVSPTA